MHREPELSSTESKTQGRIRKILQTFDVNGARPFTIPASTSTSKELPSDRSERSRCVVKSIRNQSRRRKDFCYCSQVNGVVHACGHDMHGSIALGTALAFGAATVSRAGVRVFFQPAEETRDRACTLRSQYVVV